MLGEGELGYWPPGRAKAIYDFRLTIDYSRLDSSYKLQIKTKKTVGQAATLREFESSGVILI